jgi:hypothetical protein
MMPLALMISTSVVAREVLEEAGWETLDAERPSPEAISDVSRIDLWVIGLPKDGFAECLRKLAALKARAPDMPIVVISPFFQDAVGDCITDVLINVPIVRYGFERELLPSAAAAA